MNYAILAAAPLLASAFFVSPLAWLALAGGVTLGAVALIWIKGEKL